MDSVDLADEVAEKEGVPRVLADHEPAVVERFQLLGSSRHPRHLGDIVTQICDKREQAGAFGRSREVASW